MKWSNYCFLCISSVWMGLYFNLLHVHLCLSITWTTAGLGTLTKHCPKKENRCKSQQTAPLGAGLRKCCPRGADGRQRAPLVAGENHTVAVQLKALQKTRGGDINMNIKCVKQWIWTTPIWARKKRRSPRARRSGKSNSKLWRMSRVWAGNKGGELQENTGAPKKEQRWSRSRSIKWARCKRKSSSWCSPTLRFKFINWKWLFIIIILTACLRLKFSFQWGKYWVNVLCFSSGVPKNGQGHGKDERGGGAKKDTEKRLKGRRETGERGKNKRKMKRMRSKKSRKKMRKGRKKGERGIPSLWVLYKGNWT